MNFIVPVTAAAQVNISFFHPWPYPPLPPAHHHHHVRFYILLFYRFFFVLVLFGDARTRVHPQELVPVSTMIQWAAARRPPSTPPPGPPAWRFELLQWARLNGCPWDESTTSEVRDSRM